MKLDRSHIGKKMCRPQWAVGFAIPLIQTSSGKFVGESEDGEPYTFSSNFDDWELYKEPEPKAVFRYDPMVWGESKPTRKEESHMHFHDKHGGISVKTLDALHQRVKAQGIEEEKISTRIYFALCVIKTVDGIRLSPHNFQSLTDAYNFYGINRVLAYPAPFDPIKGIWYYDPKESK